VLVEPRNAQKWCFSRLISGARKSAWGGAASRSESPSSLITRDFDVAAIVVLLVFNWSHAVHRWGIVELDPLGHPRSRALVFLENALGGARVRVGVGDRGQGRVLPLICPWTDGGNWGESPDA